jgi:hypothetical protein
MRRERTPYTTTGVAVARGSFLPRQEEQAHEGQQVLVGSVLNNTPISNEQHYSTSIIMAAMTSKGLIQEAQAGLTNINANFSPSRRRTTRRAAPQPLAGNFARNGSPLAAVPSASRQHIPSSSYPGGQADTLVLLASSLLALSSAPSSFTKTGGAAVGAPVKHVSDGPTHFLQQQQQRRQQLTALLRLANHLPRSDVKLSHSSFMGRRMLTTTDALQASTNTPLLMRSDETRFLSSTPKPRVKEVSTTMTVSSSSSSEE